MAAANGGDAVGRREDSLLLRVLALVVVGIVATDAAETQLSYWLCRSVL